ncbi:MAG: hypothetical protein LBL43_02355 [Treponema sp.]|jgi:hypothetical protein|nr:hypothetical protein [Treponema sp.]
MFRVHILVRFPALDEEVSAGYYGFMNERKRFVFRLRNMKIILFFLALIIPGFLVPGVLFSQSGSGDSVFAPFISQLSAETKNNLIRLSWLDSRDVRGPVYIFRSSQPFRPGPLPGNIRPTEVPYRTQSYVDETEGSGTVYYFVAASDETGRRYDILIPYSNTVSVDISGPPGEPPLSAAPEGEPPVRPSEPGIFGIEAKAEGEGVIISYRSANGNKNILLYRSVQPLRTAGDLLRAVIVQAEVRAPYTEYPVPGIPYYYAAVFEDDLIQGKVEIFPGRNATIQPVEIPPEWNRIGLPGPQRSIRSMPLPLNSVYKAGPGSDTYSEIPTPVPISPEAAKAVGDIQKAKTDPPPLKKPRAFKRDLEPPAGGEESQLRTIVQGPFLKQDWQASQTEFLRYLSLPRSSLSEARARFYLGQAYYFSGSHRAALFEFLMVQSQYPEEADDWIRAVLERITR